MLARKSSVRVCAWTAAEGRATPAERTRRRTWAATTTGGQQQQCRGRWLRKQREGDGASALDLREQPCTERSSMARTRWDADSVRRTQGGEGRQGRCGVAGTAHGEGWRAKHEKKKGKWSTDSAGSTEVIWLGTHSLENAYPRVVAITCRDRVSKRAGTCAGTLQEREIYAARATNGSHPWFASCRAPDRFLLPLHVKPPPP